MSISCILTPIPVSVIEPSVYQMDGSLSLVYRMMLNVKSDIEHQHSKSTMLCSVDVHKPFEYNGNIISSKIKLQTQFVVQLF